MDEEALRKILESGYDLTWTDTEGVKIKPSESSDKEPKIDEETEIEPWHLAEKYHQERKEKSPEEAWKHITDEIKSEPTRYFHQWSVGSTDRGDFIIKKVREELDERS
ncbi:hypothetical protein AKJ48_02135 [candidate division MSBL1 archaeon SCGC-AAA261O19]|uniref:Uncharacterized protein n=2 Tax=candidate division MSBL1 TaxID=215777 RepID=A0A133V0E5_9EURY|nr:hypothetical protein AKJ42_02165 [candidate division MSBL1 archaeon SCGC-AAA261C02]KXB04577.1 hypothetical protein AKJ48_02135 [candidate division MSBL1 archaeon SCGC-AAA261O19]